MMRGAAFRGGLVLALGLVTAAGASAGGSRSPRPDLVLMRVSAQGAHLRPGERFVVRDTVANRGAARARSSTTRYYVLRSGKPVALGSRQVPPLRPWKSSAGSGRALVPRLAAGTYSLVVCADAAHVVREANERNNCLVLRGAMRVVVVEPPPPPPPPPLHTGNAARVFP